VQYSTARPRTGPARCGISRYAEAVASYVPPLCRERAEFGGTDGIRWNGAGSTFAHVSEPMQGKIASRMGFRKRRKACSILVSSTPNSHVFSCLMTNLGPLPRPEGSLGEQWPSRGRPGGPLNSTTNEDFDRR
jgi:hypothetical protein